MPAQLPYLASYKNVGALFDKIASAKIPDNFTHEFLNSTIGLKASGDRPLIPLLRNLGFIDQSGRPTAEYSFLKGANRRSALAAGIRKAYGSYQIAVKSGGNFSVHSGNATLFYSPTAGMHTRREIAPMPGTIVVCAIDYSHPLLLEEALNIGGRQYSPVDMIELKYEVTGEGDILFSLAIESESFGSRTAGTPVRNKLKNLLGFLEGNRIVVDFSDVHLVSSSFADEVFGKLFVELGPLQFSAKLEFKNVDSTVRLLIDRAIMQRMGVQRS